MPYDSSGKWYGTPKSHGDGSDPEPPSPYGPPSKHYYEQKAAGERAAAKDRANRRQMAARYESAKAHTGRVYASRVRLAGRDR
ncbi:MAG: hypothetical protein AAFS13_00140 [Pseudomonadota bacterium]